MKKVLLDTNILSYFLKGNVELAIRFQQYSRYHPRLTFSLLTYYEIKSGLLYRDARKLMAQFEQLATESEILPLSIQTMDIASVVYRDLRTRGLLIAPMDLLIAASALEYNCVMVTANIRHFENIPDLVIENWSISNS